jgi:hypothetical protein
MDDVDDLFGHQTAEHGSGCLDRWHDVLPFRVHRVLGA